MRVLIDTDILNRLDAWIVRMVKEPSGFKLTELGDGGLILYGKDPLTNEIGSIGEYKASIEPPVDSAEIAARIGQDADQDADSQNEKGNFRFVVRAFRGGETDPFAKFSFQLKRGVLDEGYDGAKTLPAKLEDVPRIEGSELQIEQVRRHNEAIMRHNFVLHQMASETVLRVNDGYREELEAYRKSHLEVMGQLKVLIEAKHEQEIRTGTMQQDAAIKAAVLGQVFELFNEVKPMLQSWFMQWAQNKLNSGEQK